MKKLLFIFYLAITACGSFAQTGSAELPGIITSGFHRRGKVNLTVTAFQPLAWTNVQPSNKGTALPINGTPWSVLLDQVNSIGTIGSGNTHALPPFNDAIFPDSVLFAFITATELHVVVSSLNIHKVYNFVTASTAFRTENGPTVISINGTSQTTPGNPGNGGNFYKMFYKGIKPDSFGNVTIIVTCPSGSGTGFDPILCGFTIEER